MKRLLAGALALFSALTFGATLTPIQLLNPAGSTAGQVISSTGATTAPVWGGVTLGSVTGTLAVSNGGTAVSAASGTALDNITGFSGTGFLTRTGAGTYAFQSSTNGITLGNLAQAAGNTVLANATGSTANVAAFSMPSCSTSVSALNWTTSTGFTCNTGLITAATVSSTYAPLASPTFTGTLNAANVTASGTFSGATAGVTNGVAAAAGIVGEAQVADTTGTSLTSTVAANMTSKLLQAGDWDVDCNVRFIPAGTTTIQALIASISTTSAVAGPVSQLNQLNVSFTTGQNQILVTPRVILNISTPTTVYCVASASFGVSTMTGDGHLTARRMR